MSLIGDLYLTHPAWIWAGLAAALLAAEVATGTGWLLWAAAAAAVVALIEVFGQLPVTAAVMLFAGLMIVSSLTARRYFPRKPRQDGEDINDNIARVVGHEGRVVGAFRGGVGRVFIDGKEWAAEQEGEGALEAGAKVRVAGVSGARLRVHGV
jgi:membrane protein implicated in regulation of membrane protease activity